MCYTAYPDYKGLKFLISDCFGIGFDWRSEEFKQAVLRKDQVIMDFLTWAVTGGAEAFDDAAAFESDLHNDKSARYVCSHLQHFDQETLINLLENEYLSAKHKQIIRDYFSGSLKARAHIERENERNAPKQVTRKTIGFVYLIKSNELYKIGKTKDLNSRTAFFGTIMPIEVELIHSFSSNQYSLAEAALHEKYKDFRKTGEWFALREEHIEEICRIQDGEL